MLNFIFRILLLFKYVFPTYVCTIRHCILSSFFFCFVFFLIFIYLLFLAVLGLRFVRGLSPVAASGGHSSSRRGGRSSSRCAGLSPSRLPPPRCGAQAPDAQAQQPWLTGPAAPRHVGSSQTRARTRVPCISRQILNHCTTREAPYCPVFKCFLFLTSKENYTFCILLLLYYFSRTFLRHLNVVATKCYSFTFTCVLQVMYNI